MYLESFVIKNYRKFGETENLISFVDPKAIISREIKDDDSEIVDGLVAPSTTLIVGKNNSGKTTVANALKQAVNAPKPKSTDFNLKYLRRIFNESRESYKVGQLQEVATPELEFRLNISINFNSSDGDLVNNLLGFVSISSEQCGNVEIIVRFEVDETIAFHEELGRILERSENESRLFERFLDLIDRDETRFRVAYYNFAGNLVEKVNLNRLINIKEIKANRHLKDGVLSDVFGKIVSFQFSNSAEDKSVIEKSVDSINNNISSLVGSKSSDVSSVLSKIEGDNKVGVDLGGNVTYNSIIGNLIKYRFSDGDDFIPESQFGLGYINLLNIIGEIIHYVDSYEGSSYKSKVNVLFIEEPEAFMHPQMQEFFIKRIDDAIDKAISLANNAESNSLKSLLCQVVVTTHSSHIVNSKIHSSNSFNNINYITQVRGQSAVVCLDDKTVSGTEDDDRQKDLQFIKKHIKYKVSELFFADAVILVEGVSEEVLLHYFIEQHPILRKYYVAIFNIGGAHGSLYIPLIRAIQVPSLIITDLDLVREKCEKNEKHGKDDICYRCGKESGADSVSQDYLQVTSLENRKTTNQTIINFSKMLFKQNAEETDGLFGLDYFELGNLYVVFQKDPIMGQFASSFEEALVLENYKVEALREAIKKCRPNIYREIVFVDGKECPENLVNNSYRLQKKLSECKSDFSNSILYELASSQSEGTFTLPTYIKSGLDWLQSKLVGSL